MVTIPDGKFQMGGQAWIRQVGPWERLEQPETSEQPTRHVSVPAFALERYEVTREQYAAFLAAAGREAPSNACAYWDGSEWRVDRALGWNQPGFDQDDSHPVACFS